MDDRGTCRFSPRLGGTRPHPPNPRHQRAHAMASLLAWSLFVLGAGHVGYGLFKFRAPLLAAVSAGYVNQFRAPEVRRTAFWFVIFGPLLMLAGHTAIHAVSTAALPLLKIVGWYLLAVSVIGVAALPKSPFLAGLVLSPLLIAAGHGLL
jgi:hypothetical protein